MSMLTDNTVCLAVTFHRSGNNRRLKSGEVDVRKSGSEDPTTRADQTQLGITKKIFKSEHFDAGQRIEHEFHAWLNRIDLNRTQDKEKKKLKRKIPHFQRGTYLIPLSFLDEVYARLNDAQKKYEAVADSLAETYDQAKEEARTRLKELYKEDDYPSTERLRRGFWVERKLFDFSLPGESKLSEMVYEQEKSKWNETMAEAEIEVKQALRQSCRDLVAHLVERLTPSADGKKKRLHASAVEKIVDFFDLFERRNVLNDVEMKKLCENARRVLSGGEVLADALRQNTDVQDMVRGEMERVTEKLDALISSGPRRVVTFEEEE